MNETIRPDSASTFPWATGERLPAPDLASVTAAFALGVLIAPITAENLRQGSP